MTLAEVIPEALPDAQAVKGFFDSLTLEKVIPPLVLLLVGLVAVRLLLRLFDRALERSRLERAAYAMLRSVMKVLLYFILLLLVAAQLGVDVSSLIAILSVISLALSLAVQGALTNVVGGFTLLTTRPFKAGDFVELEDQSGTVLEVSVTYTKLQTPDNKIVSIPNSTAASARITNFSAAGTRRVDLTVSASYDSPVESVKAALLRAANSPTSLFTPEPFVGVKEYGDSAITYVLQVWSSASDYWTTYFAVNEAISREFAQDGIEMTYPHLNVHLDRNP